MLSAMDPSGTKEAVAKFANCTAKSQAQFVLDGEPRLKKAG